MKVRLLTPAGETPATVIGYGSRSAVLEHDDGFAIVDPEDLGDRFVLYPAPIRPGRWASVRDLVIASKAQTALQHIKRIRL